MKLEEEDGYHIVAYSSDETMRLDEHLSILSTQVCDVQMYCAIERYISRLAIVRVLSGNAGK